MRAAAVLLPAALLLWALPPALALSAQTAPVPENAEAAPDGKGMELQELQREAADLLSRAAEAEPGEAVRLFAEAARRLEALAAPAELPDAMRQELRQAASALSAKIGIGPGNDPAAVARPHLQLLDRVGARLKAGAGLGLSFQGSYTEVKVAEPAYGGHASAMGPPPVDPASFAEVGTPAGSSVSFAEVPGPWVKAYCGGPTKDHILESGGSGVAVFDYDGDGRLDLYFVTAFELSGTRERIPHRNALFRNLGGWKFEDVSQAAGVAAAAWGNGACVGDYDDDGDLDLYVTHFGPNRLFRNDGQGTFAEAAAAAGVQAPGWSTGCTFFDADADGDLDLYVARYVATSWSDLARAERTLTWRGGPKTMVGPVGLPGEADLFFQNRGDGTFAEATEAHGLNDAAGAYGFGVVATDYDDDGWVDLFVANDTNPNFLYRNDGGGRFESVGLLSGVALNVEGRAQAGMGVDSGDYDGDGRLDLVVTNFAHDTDTLFRNLDGAHFEDATAASGLAGSSFARMGWGVAFADLDLDGDLDLVFANGHIYPDVDRFPSLQETFQQKNQLLLNDGGRFRDVSAAAGLEAAKSSRGLATGDLDGDGDLDLVVSNMDDLPTVLENRQQTGHQWVAFRLRHPGRNRYGIGAKVWVEAAGRRQVREIRSGGSYLSQSELMARFGLGTYRGTVDVEVRMPGGRRWVFKGLPTGRVHVLTLDHGERAPGGR